MGNRVERWFFGPACICRRWPGRSGPASARLRSRSLKEEKMNLKKPCFSLKIFKHTGCLRRALRPGLPLPGRVERPRVGALEDVVEDVDAAVHAPVLSLALVPIIIFYFKIMGEAEVFLFFFFKTEPEPVARVEEGVGLVLLGPGHGVGRVVVLDDVGEDEVGLEVGLREELLADGDALGHGGGRVDGPGAVARAGGGRRDAVDGQFAVVRVVVPYVPF